MGFHGFQQQEPAAIGGDGIVGLVGGVKRLRIEEKSGMFLDGTLVEVEAINIGSV